MAGAINEVGYNLLQDCFWLVRPSYDILMFLCALALAFRRQHSPLHSHPPSTTHPHFPLPLSLPLITEFRSSMLPAQLMLPPTRLLIFLTWLIPASNKPFTISPLLCRSGFLLDLITFSSPTILTCACQGDRGLGGGGAWPLLMAL